MSGRPERSGDDEQTREESHGGPYASPAALVSPWPSRAARIPRELRAYRTWALAQQIEEGVRGAPFIDLVQRIEQGIRHQCPPIRLMVDGEEAFREVVRCLDAAREEILVETYILRDDRIGDSVQRALVAAVARGVRVSVLADAVGSLATAEKFWESLQAEGVTVRLFHRLRHVPLEALRRDHRKIIVIDRHVAFTGGMNIGEEYGSSISSHSDAWRDTFLRVEGSVALELAAVFAEGWDRAGGPPLPGLEYVSWSEGVVVPAHDSEHALEHAREHARGARGLRARVEQRVGKRRDKRRGRRVRRVSPETTASIQNEAEPTSVGTALVLDSRPGRGQREMLAVMSAMVGGARERIWVTTPYFAPPTRALTLLAGAAMRGVDVRLLLPGPQADVPIIRHAAHGAYGRLLTAGVRIFEYQRAMLHAKTVVVDGHASIVGSSNLDFRSFWLNAECNLLIFDDGLGQGLERAFEEDASTSEEIQLASWRQRGLAHRMLDRFARSVRFAL